MQNFKSPRFTQFWSLKCSGYTSNNCMSYCQPWVLACMYMHTIIFTVHIPYTVVRKKFAVGYYHVKFVRGKIFSSLGVCNKKHYFLFIVKNISCVQFSTCHTSNENFLLSNFSQTTVHIYIIKILFYMNYESVVIAH